MTRLLLVRHALHDWIGRGFAGRMEGVALNAEGLRQAQALAARFPDNGVDALYCSPRQRARETAAAVAQRLGLPVQLAPEFDEIDFGDWTGRTFDDVRSAEPEAWQQWIHHRAMAAPPGGEPFAHAAQRATAAALELADRHPDGCVVVCSHGDVIKAVIATCLGLSLDQLERFDIACASVSEIELGAAPRVVLLNAPGPSMGVIA